MVGVGAGGKTPLIDPPLVLNIIFNHKIINFFAQPPLRLSKITDFSKKIKKFNLQMVTSF